MKMMRTHSLVSGLGTLLLAVLLAGCGGKSPAVVYYSLASIEQGAFALNAEDRRDVTLGIGPVTVPEYLKKAQIATRSGNGTYRFDEFHRWAGLIEQDLATVIGNNLGLLLGTDKVASFPWRHYFKPDYRVSVEVIRFDSDLSGEALLSARWAVSDASGENLLASGKNDYRQALAQPSYAALVEAESLLLAEFSRELATALKSLLPRK